MRWLVAILILLWTFPVQAQQRGPIGTAIQNIERRNEAVASPSIGDEVEDKIVAHIEKLGQAILIDLKYAREMAAYKNPAGTEADPAGRSCYDAVIPIAELIINGPKTEGGDALTKPEPALVTKFEKARIIHLAINNQDFRNACGAMRSEISDTVRRVIGPAAIFGRLIGVGGLL